MKPRLQLTAPDILHMFGAVVLVGSVISAINTADKRWMSWHFSRLGEGGHASSTIFNISMFVGGLLMSWLSYELIQLIRKFKSDKRLDALYAENLLKMIFPMIAVCLFGVSLFPFDKFPVIHNSFGYGMTFIMLGLCTLTPQYITLFPKWFYRYGYILLSATLLLFTIFFTLQPYTLLQVETVVFLMVFVWLEVFTRTIYDAAQAIIVPNS